MVQQGDLVLVALQGGGFALFCEFIAEVAGHGVSSSEVERDIGEGGVLFFEILEEEETCLGIDGGEQQAAVGEDDDGVRLEGTGDVDLAQGFGEFTD